MGLGVVSKKLGLHGVQEDEDLGEELRRGGVSMVHPCMLQEHLILSLGVLSRDAHVTSIRGPESLG